MGRARPYTPGMDRRSALVLLAVFGAGVFLAGLELMITAVALPSILADLVDAGRHVGLGRAAQGELDHQRLPARLHPGDAAGRPPGRPVGCAPAVPRRRSSCSRSESRSPAWPRTSTSSSRRDSSRRSAAASSSRSGPRPRPTCSAGTARPRALGVIGALTFLGMAAGPFLGAAILVDGPPGGRPGRGRPRRLDAGRRSRRPPGAGSSTSTCRSGSSALVLAWAAGAGWETPRRAGRLDVLGAVLFGLALAAGLSRLTLLGATAVAGTDLDPATVVGRPRRAWPSSRTVAGGRPRPARPRPVPRRPPLPQSPVQRRGARLAADRVRVRDRDHRWRRVRRSGAVRRPGRAAARARGAGGGDRGRGARLGVPGPARELPRRDAGRARR